ncbi:MAG: hypothetical protein GTO60_08205 [Gammaproteobacteria bacterium]|nr:hypothetical protein [Gammaproteobacteria bacterium]NIO79298.1 hypothetical protein [Candidatus Aminicenantes bacterium]
MDNAIRCQFPDDMSMKMATQPKINYFRSPGGGMIALSINKSSITKIIPVFATRNPRQKTRGKKKRKLKKDSGS